MKNEEFESFCPTNKDEWRDWLSKNHEEKSSIWLIIHKKNSAKTNLTWSDAVDEALCFGWIDSVKKTVDDEKYRQYFGKRKAQSTWSKINKIKVKQLEKDGLMAPAGLKCIQTAKQNGSWTILDSVEELIIPDDLETAFHKFNGAKDYFLSLSKSARKIMLSHIVLAKRPETRQKRVAEIAENCGKKI